MNFGIASLGKGQISLKSLEQQIEIPELDINWTHEAPPQYVESLYAPLSAEVECVMEADINARLFSEFTGANLSRIGSPNSFTVQYSAPYQEQVRRHKKKRINKKWAKRYGYRTKFKKIRISEVSFVRHNELEFEAIGKNVEFIK